MSAYDQKMIESGQSTGGQPDASLRALPRPMSDLIYEDDIRTLETQEENARSFGAGSYKSNFEWKLDVLKQKLNQHSPDPSTNAWLSSKRAELRKWGDSPSRFRWGGTALQLGSAQTATTTIESSRASSQKPDSNDSRTSPTGPRAPSSPAPCNAPSGPRVRKHTRRDPRSQPPSNAPTGPRHP